MGIKFKAFRGQHDGTIRESVGCVDDVGDKDVLIKMTHAGLCFTDTHYIETGCVLSHENCGKIVETGRKVSHLRVGDTVGFGFVHNACGKTSCDACLQGNDTLCSEARVYGEADLDWGGFGEYAKLDGDFVHKIPDGIAPEHAAPLQCAGATVFAPFLKFDIKPIHRVGIIGIGGLGHLALQVAHKWGCSVAAFTLSDSRSEEYKALGAHEVIVTQRADGSSFVPQDEEDKFDFILSSASSHVPWDDYLDCLKPRGQIIPLANFLGKFETNRYPALLARENKVGGSLCATRYEQKKMLQFCARHDIKPAVEVLDLTQDNLNHALERLKKGQVRYRFVLRHV
ncbi:hypothetical protein E3P89_03671 [Wallemia ichthyophaga]|nr:hypothetical protein E3P89_03671 [Wallemia ichthyophaga]